jgi:hypothetical protein
MDHRPDGVRAIEGRVHSVAPMISVTVRDLRPNMAAIVNVFTFAVQEFSVFTRAEISTHFHNAGEETAIFAKRVNFPALFHRFDKLNGFRKIFHGRDIA